MNITENPVLSSPARKRTNSALCKTAVLLALLGVGPMLVQAAPADKAVASAAAVQSEHAKVNINSAPVEVLSNLHGIGTAKAQSIVDYRNKFGNFRAIEDLLAVEGIGQATLSKNRGRIAL